MTGKRSVPWWLEFPLLLLGAFVATFLVKTLLFQAFYIPSGSMETTLLVGDRVIVNKAVYSLRPVGRGDIVVFDGSGSFVESAPLPTSSSLDDLSDGLADLFGLAPPRETDFIKRVIGVAHDRVVCCDAEGLLSVNGVPLAEEEYVFPGDLPSTQYFDVTVPEGYVWVMGDHRSSSADSRAHLEGPTGGFVPVSSVVGRAFAVVWPVSDARMLDVPSSFAALPPPRDR